MGLVVGPNKQVFCKRAVAEYHLLLEGLEGLIISAFWHEWSVSGDSDVEHSQNITDFYQRSHSEASWCATFKRCTALCSSENASGNQNDLCFLLYLFPHIAMIWALSI